MPPHALMENAGLALARLAMAIAPHVTRIWIACGPGNNGGDGLVAARYLKLWGKAPIVTHLVTKKQLAPDAATALQKAIQAKVAFGDGVPQNYDLCIDALFGIGFERQLDEPYAALVTQMNARRAPVIAVDVPTGLNADTGWGGSLFVRADYTLSLLTLKPGLFTADGRDACGEIWFNSLDVVEPAQACAQLNSPPKAIARAHNTHKGSYGDVAIVGGAPGMVGAAVLASRAALYGGAGRVYVATLAANSAGVDMLQPELMYRSVEDLPYENMTVVAGCGGGSAIANYLAPLLLRAKRLVLDADALNSIAQSPTFQQQVRERPLHTTVLTPHPLEAARLLGMQGKDVQLNRVQAAQTLAERYACTVVLKGSGTVIAAPQTLPSINVTGNARLASGGTGDVLAGLLGAHLAAGNDDLSAACKAVFQHGRAADTWPCETSMTAQSLLLKP
jgi:hydroxyethylthiazole kinase-like uncharacterized protein yjeF